MTKLDRRTAPRKLSEGARDDLVDALSIYSGTEVVMNVGNDPESTEFGNQLEASLTAAGWTGEWHTAIFSGQVPSGCIIYAEGPAIEAAAALAQYLRNIGIEVTYTERGNDVTQGRRVSIGIGPLPVRD